MYALVVVVGWMSQKKPQKISGAEVQYKMQIRSLFDTDQYSKKQ